MPPPRPLRSRLTLCQALPAPRLATPRVIAALRSFPIQAASSSLPISHPRDHAPSCAPLSHPISPVHPRPRLIHGSPGRILLRSAWRTRGGSLCACPPCSRSFVTSPGRKRSDPSDDCHLSMVFRRFPGVCHEARGGTALLTHFTE